MSCVRPFHPRSCPIGRETAAVFTLDTVPPAPSPPAPGPPAPGPLLLPPGPPPGSWTGCPLARLPADPGGSDACPLPTGRHADSHACASVGRMVDDHATAPRRRRTSGSSSNAAMPLIVDAYNVLHVVGVLPPHLAGIEVPELAGLIGSSRYRGERTWLVCDGRPPAGSHHSLRFDGPIAVHYAGAGRDADAHIEQMIRASTSPRRLLVVSSDHRVRRAARRRQCRWLPSDEFLAHLAADARHRSARRGGWLTPSSRHDPSKRPPAPGAPASHASAPPPVPLSPADVDRWIREFGLDRHVLSLPARSPRGTRTAARDSAREGPDALHEQPHEPSPVTGRDDSSRASTPDRSSGAMSANDEEGASGTRASSGDHGDRERPRRRPLEHVQRLDEIDPDELESFDMGPWLEDQE